MRNGKLLRAIAQMVICVVLISPCLGVTGSFDGDPYTDVIIATSTGSGGQVDWIEYDPTGGAVLHVIRPYIAQSFNHLVLEDLDGDRYPDLIVGSEYGLLWYEAYHNDEVYLVRQIATGFYSDLCVVDGNIYACKPEVGGSYVDRISFPNNNTSTLATIDESDTKQYNMIIANDFDYDGKTEVILGWQWLSDPNAGQIDIYEDLDTELSFIGTLLYNKPGGYCGYAGSIDGDFFADVIVSQLPSPDTPQTFWYEADGTDNGLVQRQRVAYQATNNLFVADIDVDGKTDLVISMMDNGETTAWYEATADNTLTKVTSFNEYHRSNGLAWGDWDSDGLVDVFYGSKLGTYGLLQAEITADDTVSAMGQFSGHQTITAVVVSQPPANCGDAGSSVFTADFNNDCGVDMVDLSVMAGNWLVVDDPNGF